MVEGESVHQNGSGKEDEMGLEPGAVRRRAVSWFTDKIVYPRLVPHEFRKSRRRFWRRRGRLIDLLDVQTSQWNQAQTASITIDCGVDVVGAHWLLNGEDGPSPPVASAAVLRARLAELAPRKGAKFGAGRWTVGGDLSAADRAAIDDDIRHRIEDHALPWFGQFESVRDVSNYLMGEDWAPGLGRTSYRAIPQSHLDLRRAAACLALDGNTSKALEILSLATKEAGGRTLETDEEIRGRILMLDNGGS